MNEHLKEMYEPILNAFQDGYLIVCFSEVKDSLLMWSHYAKAHTGFCIEYNFKELGPKIPLTRMLMPVIYTDDLFDATQYVLNPIIKGHRYNNLFGIYTSISKGKEWEYESEWRTIFPLGPDADDEQRFIKVPTPKALYVGYKANLQDINSLKKMAISKNIPLYQMTLSEHSRKLNEETIYSPDNS
ncbi:MAG: DUF2971 domain-containing protein [Candidatus Syntrophonatronum acetioxidans]|uniref:DUF2971 domain-containing protein n=1 Tax=Candidatus Syntrophonatronum acetioxidans TaxID=1795816 RepID=A0A424YAK8_9FIRM|nr:MAG: DUF2971 domain-containing protein [Candidatus Syntrophonatronum acetioxidans]